MLAVLGLTSSEIGQACLGTLVALVGYILHRKSGHIEVKVNGQMSVMVSRITQLEERLSTHGVTIPPAPPPAEILAATAAVQELGKNGPT